MRIDVPMSDTLPDGRGVRVAVVASRFNPEVTARLVSGARDALTAAGVLSHSIEHFAVPGAFELPVAARLAADSRRFDAIVCLGCIIRGETPHFDYISAAVAHGLTQVSVSTGVPIAFGVLTTDTPEQADARSRPDRTNKGYEAAAAALEMALLRQQLRDRLAAGSRG
ncbi:MAG: 6,7-dimethyl-8-ribityllumazine synthase [Vicinamibacterales bacterium]